MAYEEEGKEGRRAERRKGKGLKVNEDDDEKEVEKS